MARYTAKFAHLESLPTLKEGQIIKRGEKLGRMGSTGKSNANHLHFGLIKEFHAKIWRLSEIEFDREHATQSSYFIDHELFGIEPHITTFYCDPTYNDGRGNWICHPCYDFVPADRHITDKHFDIFWNRSMPGQVLKIGRDFDDLTKGYGYYCLIGFDA